MPRRLWPGQGNIIPHLALQCHVGNQAAVGFGVEARQIAGIWIAVRVAIGHIEEQHEFMSAGQCGGVMHGIHPPGVLFFNDLIYRLAADPGAALVVVADDETALFLQP